MGTIYADRKGGNSTFERPPFAGWAFFCVSYKTLSTDLY